MPEENQPRERPTVDTRSSYASVGGDVDVPGPQNYDEEAGLVSENDDHRRAYPPTTPISLSTPTYLSYKKPQGLIAGFWWRWNGGGYPVPTWGESVMAFVKCSWLNLLFIFIPIAWAAHFLHWANPAIFALSLVALIPLESLIEFTGEQCALYTGESLGALIVITLDNLVETALAITLLGRCELVLLQSTLIGVILLHLLLAPGVSFMTGGAQLLHQELDPHVTEVNHTLLTIGVLMLLIPAAFYAGITLNIVPQDYEHGEHGGNNTTTEVVEHVRRLFTRSNGIFEDKKTPVYALSDISRGRLLHVSRALALLLLIIYIASRIYLHNPPGSKSRRKLRSRRRGQVPTSPTTTEDDPSVYEAEQAEVNSWSCLVLFMISIPITITSTEFLLQSLDVVRENSGISEVWFGLILLPLVSFMADALVTCGYFLRQAFFRAPKAPEESAKARTIDLSIQFILLWAPVLVLAAWAMDKPLTLLFDMFEVAVVIGACFLVNTTTKDAKTNWVEGLVMVAFWLAIAVAAWYYEGQQMAEYLLQCEGITTALESDGLSLDSIYSTS